MQTMKRDWLKIAEYLSLAGAVGGAIAAVLLQAVIYGAVLLFLSLWLNLIIRYRWHQINQEQIIHTTIILENLLSDIRSAIAQRVEQMKTEIARGDRTEQNQADHEDIDRLMTTIAQVQGELSTLDESVTPVKEQLETLIAIVQNHSVSPQQFEHWQEKLADILTRVEARSISSDALAEVTKLHQEIDHWIAQLKQMQAIAPASVSSPSSPEETPSLTAAIAEAVTEGDRQQEETAQPFPEPIDQPPIEPESVLSKTAASSQETWQQETWQQETWQQETWQQETRQQEGTAEIFTESRTPEQSFALTQREPDSAPGTPQLMPESGAFTTHPQPIWQGYEPSPESQSLAFTQFSDPLTLVTSEPTPHLDLSHTNLSGVSLTGANLASAILIQANLSETDLSGADLRGADLRGADLNGANLDRADLEAANLAAANLIGVNLRTADLRGANLSATNLSGQNLSGLNLSHINFSGANLAAANLAATNLSGTQLMAANLIDANLTEANLELANLSGANLAGAEIQRANFGEADRQATLTGAIMPDGTSHD